MNKVVQSEQPKETKAIDWSKDQYARAWIDVSLSNKIIDKAEIMRKVAELYSRKPSAIKSWYYRHMEPNGFEDYWLDKYRTHYQKRLAPRGYAKLNDLVDKERDISKVVEAIQQAEGKQQAPAIQVNNFIKNEKNTYGIS